MEYKFNRVKQKKIEIFERKKKILIFLKIRFYYTERAILRNEEDFQVLLSLCETLKIFDFDFVIKDKGLDDIDYWTKVISKRFSLSYIFQFTFILNSLSLL